MKEKKEIWEPEEIEDNEIIYRRVQKIFVQNILESNENNFLKIVPPNVFYEPSENWKNERLINWDGVSVDWKKYSNPNDTITRDGKKRENYGVFQVSVKNVREFPPLNVIHSPVQDNVKLEDNRAHSLITGFKLENKVSIRMSLSEKCEWALQGWSM